jgi:hypothetical protein
MDAKQLWGRIKVKIKFEKDQGVVVSGEPVSKKDAAKISLPLMFFLIFFSHFVFAARANEAVTISGIEIGVVERVDENGFSSNPRLVLKSTLRGNVCLRWFYPLDDASKLDQSAVEAIYGGVHISQIALARSDSCNGVVYSTLNSLDQSVAILLYEAFSKKYIISNYAAKDSYEEKLRKCISSKKFVGLQSIRLQSFGVDAKKEYFSEIAGCDSGPKFLRAIFSMNGKKVDQIRIVEADRRL